MPNLLKVVRMTAPATVLTAALAISGGCTVTISAQTVERSFERTLSTTAGTVELDVRTASGGIDVTTGESGTVRITGHIRARVRGSTSQAEAEERARAIETNPPIEQDGNLIRISRVERSLRRNVSVSYEIVVPPDTTVRSQTGSGRQRVEGVRGSVEATTGSGRVTVSNVAGDVTAETGSGRIELTMIGGDTDAETGSGRIRIDGLRAALAARTGSGSISAVGAPDGDWSLRTGSGSVTVDFPDDARFELDARSGSGRVETDHPVTVTGTIDRRSLRGTVRGGGPSVVIRTGSGRITVD